MKKFLHYIFLAIISLFIIHYSLFISPRWAKAASPTDDYHLKKFFPLLRFIPTAELKVFENYDRSRKYEDIYIKTISEVSVCEDSSECIAQYQSCGPSGCGPVQTGHGSCIIKKPNLTGKCRYTKNPSCGAPLGGSDYSSSQNLVYPKYQNEWQRYDYPGISSNPITSGAHNLALSVCDQAELKLITLTQAAQTKDVVEATDQWPLGWVDWEYITPSGNSLIELWGKTGSLHDLGKRFTQAHDLFLMSVGQSVLDVSASKNELCKKIQNESTSPEIKALLDAPLYAPSSAKGYGRCSICVEKKCKSEPYPTGEGLYTDLSVRAAFSAALTNLNIILQKDDIPKVLKRVRSLNPLFPYTQIATTVALPENIAKSLKPARSNLPSPFTLTALGNIYDYQELMDKYGYLLAKEGDGILGGAMPTSVGQSIMDFLYGVISLFLDVKKHLIIIPEPMAQSLFLLQNPTYITRDTLIDQQKDEYQSLSTLVESSLPINIGKPLGPGEGRRDIALLSCSDTDYSSPNENIIADYAQGTRIGCTDSSLEVPVGKCDGQLFGKLLESGKYQKSSAKGETYFNTHIKGNLTPELMNTYAAAEKETGVPCEILAGIHFVEAGNSPDGSLVSGRKIGTPEPDAGGKIFHSLLETAKYAGDHLKGKVGGSLKDVNTVITALSRYNGGGNSNCQAGYPYPIPYGGCPRAFEGEDDPYPMSFVDPKHDKMYLLYCADHTACLPQIFERPGAFAVALNVYNSFTKSGYENSQLPSTQTNPAPAPSIAPDGSTTSTGFFPKSCGPESLSTALGCLPYTRDAFISTLLTFIIGLAGGIALVIMLVATFQIMTAGGNPEQLKKGKELFTSAIIGLLFLIFSVSLLRLVAGDIIKLPGF